MVLRPCVGTFTKGLIEEKQLQAFFDELCNKWQKRKAMMPPISKYVYKPVQS